MTPNNSNIQEDDFLSLYLQYTTGTECPTIFHRWCAITSLGAWLSRDIYFLQGHFKIHPNLYVMLVGDAGTKKSTSIKMSTRLMKLAGYRKYAAKKTRQEKFLLDMAEQAATGASGEVDILDQNLFGDIPENLNIAETLIAADEFNNFIGVGNVEFMSILGELWDYEDDIFDYKLKNSKSIYLNSPTVSILGGNTPTGMNLCFPVDAIGQGFFSRLILVHAEPNGEKQTWMGLECEILQKKLIARLVEIKETMHGRVILTPESDALLDKIYKAWQPIDDVRFASYANRRFTILLKLILVVCANNLTMQITKKEVIYANTLLVAVEKNMSQALGEFGRSRNSDVTHKVLKFIDTASEPLPFKEVWKQVYSDLEKRDQLVEILSNLLMAEKIQQLPQGYLPRKDVRVNEEADTVDWNLLSVEERR